MNWAEQVLAKVRESAAIADDRVTMDDSGEGLTLKHPTLNSPLALRKRQFADPLDAAPHFVHWLKTGNISSLKTAP